MSAPHPVTLPPPDPNPAEVLRYAMQPRCAAMPEELPLARCLAAAKGVVCRAVWQRYDCRADGETLDLGFSRTASKSLREWLGDSHAVILFAATAGFEMDRLIARAGLVSPAEGLLMHAVGAAVIEQACDRLCALLCETFPEERLKPRFSPGYGDLPLSMQRDIFAALDCGRRLGLTLREPSLLMTPSKSVTAIIGLERREPDEHS